MLKFKDFQASLEESLEGLDEGSVYQVIHHGHSTGEGDYKIFPKGNKVINLTTKFAGSATKTAKLLKDKGFHQVEIHKNGKKLDESEEIVEASTGNAFDWKNYTADRKGVGVHGSTKTYHDVKKTSTGTVYTKQTDTDGTSKGTGDDAAKAAEKAEQPKRGRGRPKGVGAKSGSYKPRDPAKKAASAAKAAATKAANRKARNEEFNQEFIEELMAMLVEDQDVEDFMDLLQEEEFDEFYVSEIEAIEEACKSKKKKTPVTESTVSAYAKFIK